MAKSLVDPRLQAWLATRIATSLSPIKRKNYMTRLLAWLGQEESGLKSSATWPRLPLAWTGFASWEASRQGGMPWPVWPNYGVAYHAMLLKANDVGAFLTALAAFATPFVTQGVVTRLWTWVAWDQARAWVLVHAHPDLGHWSDGEEWQEPWAGAGHRVWVEWSRVAKPPKLRVRWDEIDGRRDFVPDAWPAPRDFAFAADDVEQMCRLLAAGPMGTTPADLCQWLLERHARGEVQVRLVPLVFEGIACLPNDAAFTG